MLGALFGFGGRLSRPGYWEVLMSVVLIDVALVIGRMFVADSGLPGGYGPSSPLAQALLQATPWVLGVFTVWSLLAAAIKRCHDRGRTGFLILVGLIPVFGWLWLLIDLFFLEGSEGRNRYGRAPHAPVADTQSGFTWGADLAPAAAPSAFASHETPAEAAHHGHDAAHHVPEPAAHDDHGHGAGHAAEVHDDHGHAQASHDHHDDHGHDDHGHDDHGHDAHEPVHAEDSHGAADHASEAHGHSEEHHAEPAGGDSHGHDAHASASHDHDAGAGAHAPAVAHSH